MAKEDGAFHWLSKRGLVCENPPNEDYFWKEKQEINSSDYHWVKKLEGQLGGIAFSSHPFAHFAM